MYLYLGIVMILHSCYSLSEFRKFKVKYTGSHYIPKDIMVEFFLGIILVVVYVSSLLTKLKSVKLEQKPYIAYSNSLSSNLREFRSQRKFFVAQLFTEKFKDLLKIMNK